MIGDQDIVFQPDTQAFFPDVYAGFTGYDHTCLQGYIAVGEVVNIQSQMVSDAVHKIALNVFFVRIFGSHQTQFI